MKRWISVLVVVFFLIGAATFNYWKPGPRAVKHPPNNDPWKLVSYDPDNPYGTYLGNGFIATRVMGDGVGTKCYMAGLYDNEKLIPSPNWADLRFSNGMVAASEFRIDKTRPYRQTLDLRTGTLTTSATWRYEKRTLTGAIDVVVSRAQPDVALVKARLSANTDGLVFAYVPIDSDDCWVQGDNQDEPITEDYDVYVTTWRLRHSRRFVVIANAEVLERRARRYPKDPRDPRVLGAVMAKAGKPFEVLRYACVAAGADPASAQGKALGDLRAAMDTGQRFVADHKAAWAKLWKKDIIIDGPAKDQQAIHSCMFYILQSVREGSQWSIPPMGLSSDAFSGHVFWDADVWIFPALLLQHPELARSIVDYRFNTLAGAMANAKASGYAGAEYAWESGYTGREDTPEGLSYRHERHINGDVALAQWQYYLATGNNEWLRTRGYPVLKATADYWVSRVTYNAAKNRYEILKVVPPDENAEIINNSVYTNAIAKMNLEFAAKAAEIVGAAPNPKWAEVAAKMYIPFDAGKKRFIPFDGYKGYKAKQADTELLIYPLQYNIPGQDMTDIYKNTFEFYQPKVLENGPAMSSSAHAVIAARLGDCTSAYKYWRESWTPFVRGPFNYFNEKRSKTWDQMCFLTGAAGPVQSALFGIAGARIDYDDSDVGLSFKPCLPTQWKSLKITGLQWRGSLMSTPLTILPGNKVKGGAFVYNFEGPVRDVQMMPGKRPAQLR